MRTAQPYLSSFFSNLFLSSPFFHSTCFDLTLLFMQVHDWPVSPLGLLYDRGWMVVNGNGVCLSQKREPRLCLIRPQVHIRSNKLLLQAPGQTLSPWLTGNTFLKYMSKFQLVRFLCRKLQRGFLFCFFFNRPTGMETISVPLENNNHSHTRVCHSKVCGDR